MAVEKASTKKATAEKKVEDSTVGDVELLEKQADAEAGVEPEVHDILLVREERFRLVSAIPAITMMKLSAASDPKTPIPKQMDAMRSFLERVVVEEDREAFLAYLEDADPIIDFDEINTILTDATEAIAARPTQP
jgi:hypothetical protein